MACPQGAILGDHKRSVNGHILCTDGGDLREKRTWT